MAVAIWIDQRLAAHAAAPGQRAASAAVAAGAEVTVAALSAGEVARLLPGVAGWALVRRDGELLATNLSRRAALLSAACVALRIESDGRMEGGGPHVTHIASSEGALFGAISGQGVILAALAPGAADVQRLETGLQHALLLAGARLEPEPVRVAGRHARGARTPLPSRPL